MTIMSSRRLIWQNNLLLYSLCSIDFVLMAAAFSVCGFDSKHAQEKSRMVPSVCMVKRQNLVHGKSSTRA